MSVGLRCEWAKCQARSDRWSEEVQLLVEEMRRVICYLDWRANWWLLRVASRSTVDVELAEGLRAYAYKQEHVSRTMAASFAKQWYPLLQANHIAITWPAQYIDAL